MRRIRNWRRGWRHIRTAKQGASLLADDIAKQGTDLLAYDIAKQGTDLLAGIAKRGADLLARHIDG